MDYASLFGFTAASLTSVAFFPQVVKAWRSKSTRDVSLITFTITCTGLFLWVVYGIYINSMPVIGANIVTLILAIMIVILKLKYK